MTSKSSHHTTEQSLAAHYLALADEAHSLANTTTFTELRNSYLRYEAHWRALAMEADQRHAPGAFRQWLMRLASKFRRD